jgi:phospholipase C
LADEDVAIACSFSAHPSLYRALCVCRFDTFQKAKPGSALYDKGMTRVKTNQLVAEFETDLKTGKLPQVSWLVAPANQSEHASNHPAVGDGAIASFPNNRASTPATIQQSATEPLCPFANNAM